MRLGGRPRSGRAASVLPVDSLRSLAGFSSLAGALCKMGLKAQAPAQIQGRSGVKHEFALAVRTEAKANVVLDAELSLNEVDEMKVVRFYIKVLDVGPQRAILCVSPRLDKRAALLAKEYGVAVLESEEPVRLARMAARRIDIAMRRSGH